MLRRRLGAAYETVDDCRHDVTAWVEFLKSCGHKRIILIGHSLGGLDARRLQADPFWRDRILSLTTIGTPHLGTYLADFAKPGDVIPIFVQKSHAFAPPADDATPMHASTSPMAEQLGLVTM